MNKKSSTDTATFAEESSSRASLDGDDNDTMSTWLQGFAIFGDSTFALGLSFALLLVSIGTAWYFDDENVAISIPSLSSFVAIDPVAENYRKLGPVPEWIETSASVLEYKEDDEFFDYIKALFDKDGVIALRGLIEPDLLERLDQTSSELIQKEYAKKKSKPKGLLTGKNQQPQPTGTQFFTVKEGAIYMELNSTTNNETEDEEKVIPAFLEVALQSKIPQIISQALLQLPSNETLRLMRDIFLAKDTDEYVCGWHVDDTGFWPATAEAPGVNAWIALDDMPVNGGGGFALAVGSHIADWRHDAYHVTGSTHTFPPEGFTSAKDVLERRVGNGTCNVATAAPHLHKRMEETKRIYNMKRGDVILHTRWLFHRTVPFDRSVVQERQEQQQQQQQEESALLYRRYSIRYGPGSSEIPRGYGTEPSVLWNERNGGRTADEVAALDAPWYPQAWPEPPKNQRKQLEDIATERLAKVTHMADARKQQLKRARKSATRQQMNRQPH